LGGTFTPLRHPDFRRIWSASLLSNFGLLINGVGAGWAMTEMSGRPAQVALVQSALLLPYMLFAVPAGAISDTYDRRKVGIAMLLFAAASASVLTTTAWLGLLTPPLLLALCFLSGTANAMFAPAWQSSVSEQVPGEDLPEAVALNSVSYNIARSFGPAVGGAIVAAAGAVAAFGVTAVCYLPITLALYLWKREPDTPRLPPERIGGAILSGLRFAWHSPVVRRVIARSVLFGMAGASISALMPLIARDLMGGQAATYGILLGAFGLGAVIGALAMPFLSRLMPTEARMAGSVAVLGLAMLALSRSHSNLAAIPLLILCGACWLQPQTQCNIELQSQAPRWVSGRALASFQAAAAGGIAVGSWLWGRVAEQVGTADALGLSGFAMLACVSLSWLMRFPDHRIDTAESAPLQDPEARLAITGRSGPIAIEVEYRVDPERARAFYTAMLGVAPFRQRNGAYQWSLARDISDDHLWVERFTCPTWHDYLRQRDRMTLGEQALLQAALDETLDGTFGHVRRLLERPVGSVRWRAESRDNGLTAPLNGAWPDR